MTSPGPARSPLIGLNAHVGDSFLDDVRRAEEAGFDFIGCGEHLFFHGASPNAFVYLAAAAGATSRIRLVSSVTVLPLYPAALAAKLAAGVDLVSRGRFELGVGAGGEFPLEFEAVGVATGSRFRRLDEGLQVIRALFAGGPVDFEGEFTTLRGVALDPGVVQPGGPPIWVGGRRAGAIRRAGTYADVWMPYMVSPGSVARTLADVRAVAAERGRPDGSVTGAVLLWTCVDRDGDEARRIGTETVSTFYAQDFRDLAERYLVLGTPDEVAARIAEYHRAGAERILIQPAVPEAGLPHMLDLLVTDVLPRLRAA